MKIEELIVSNFKRIRSVKITPSDASVVIITGRNDQGKTSTLDAIWALFGGKDSMPAVPIRTGEAEAAIFANLKGEGEDLRVTRRIKRREDGTVAQSLIVENPDGTRKMDPQTFLTGLRGRLTMDPVEFVRMPAKEQAKVAQALVPGFDFVEADREYKDVFARRTDVNRLAGDARTQAAGINVPLDAAVEAADVGALLTELEEAERANSALYNEELRRRTLTRATEEKVAAVERRKLEIEQATQSLAAFKRDLDMMEQVVVADRQAIVELPMLGKEVDTKAIRAKIADADRVKGIVQQRARKLELETKARDHENRSTTLTETLHTIKAAKAKAIEDAKLPVEGLAFDEDVVTYQGLPLEQASMMVQIRVSIAIAAALNPKVRIALVRQGAFLDREHMGIVSQEAADRGLQLWIERVESTEPGALVIEDGMVSEVIPKAPEPKAELGVSYNAKKPVAKKPASRKRT